MNINLNMSKFESTVIDENFQEQQGGKEIKPPLIPSNTEKIYTNPGIYNLKGFYEDLNIRLDKQKQTLTRIEENSRKNLNVTNVSIVTSART